MDYFKSNGTKDAIYKEYLAERNNENFAKLSQYYFDTAESLFSKGDSKNGLRVLSTLAELDLENPQFLR
jgi:Ca-activated chloride channel homolog